jgi:Spy/CpxP family protein refolding chaperone
VALSNGIVDPNTFEVRIMSFNNRLYAGALATLITFGVGGALQSALADASNDAPPPMARHQHGPQMRHGGPEGAFMAVLHELKLSDEQKVRVHAIMDTGRPHDGAGATGEDFLALGNPGDANHAAAVQAAKTRAAERIQHWSDVQQQVYAVLTPAQQAQLPDVLKAMQARFAAHRGGNPPPPDAAPTP